MSNTEMVLNDKLPSAKDSPGRQAAGNTSDIEDGRNTMSQRSFRTSENSSSNAEAKVPDESPKEQSGLFRNIYRLSKRRLSFTPPKSSDKDVTKVMSNENTTNNLREEEEECVENKTVENTKSSLSEVLPKSKTMSNTEKELNDNLPSAKDSPGQGQAAGNTSDIEDGRNKMSQRSFRTSENNSSNAEVKASDESPKEQSGLFRNIYRLSKRRLSFTPPKSSDKDVTKVMLNENTTNNLREEEECVEDKTVENTKSPLSEVLPKSKTMSNTEKELIDNLPSAKDSPGQGQAAGNTSDIEDGRNTMSQRSFRTSENNSSNAEVKASDESPKEQSGLFRNIYRLSKRRLSFTPPKSSDKDVTKVMLNENTTNNLREEEECVEDKTVENTKSPLSEVLPKSKTMLNTEKELNDNLPSAMDSPGQGQAAGNTLDIEDGRNKMSQRSFRTSKNNSSNAEAKAPDESPKEQSGLFRNIYRLSKRKLSFPPPKSSDKDVTKVMSNENTAHNLREEEECVEVKSIENTKSPLSVMEINQLITKKMLLDANENINKMEKELLNDRKPTNDQQYMVKVRDLNLLCDALVGQMMYIVANSLTIAKENGNYLCWTMKVVEMEEAADKDWQEQKNLSDIECFRRPRKWRELWRETVTRSVKDRIDNVPLRTKEKGSCMMAQHLSDVQEIIVEDLKTVKNFIQKCYPESYNIFSMYVKCYHQTVASHLESILQKQFEPNDLYSLLNWIIHTYKSDAVMNHPELSPEVNIEGLGPLLDEKIIKNIMDKYIEALKLTVPLWMKNAVKEDEAKWSESEAYVPEIMMDCYHSHIASDLSEIISAHLNESGKISKDLKEKVLCYCLKELTNLIHCYQEDLKVRKQSVQDPLPLLIVSINSYIDLGEFIKFHKEDNSASFDEVEKALNEALHELNKILSDDLLSKVLCCFKKIMTNKQLSSSEDFDQLMSMTRKYCIELRKMKEANYQVVISDLHYQFVREYITALMKKKIKKTSSKHLTATKIREELGAINKIYEEFGSTALWLFPKTQHLFDFIDGDESELESKLRALFEGCPEIGEEHISALLHIRGISKGQKKTNLMKYFNQLKKNSKDPRETTHPFLFEKK
ncbi:exocyst complex component 3-like [Hemitrygon akajei]|uniref:exocyst complex component 3-like n=1 Tax=Hemitrygon akajei TaxID=2704970 RepID=UPI003BF95EB0